MRKESLETSSAAGVMNLSDIVGLICSILTNLCAHNNERTETETQTAHLGKDQQCQQ
jgi:hypothetical protein